MPWHIGKKCPYRYRYQLEQWANKRWPDNKTKHARMSRKQLYAIWYSQ